MARTAPSAYLAQPKLATQTSWGGHLGPSLDPPPVPSPGTGGEGRATRTEKRRHSPGGRRFWHSAPCCPGAVSESPCDTAKSGILLGTRESGHWKVLSVCIHTHMGFTAVGSHTAPGFCPPSSLPLPPSTNMLISQQKTYLQILVRYVYI